MPAVGFQLVNTAGPSAAIRMLLRRTTACGVDKDFEHVITISVSARDALLSGTITPMQLIGYYKTEILAQLQQSEFLASEWRVDATWDDATTAYNDISAL